VPGDSARFRRLARWRLPSSKCLRPRLVLHLESHAFHPTRMKRAADGFSADVTRRAVAISYRQLDYWDKTGLLRPSVQRARGKGSRRIYSFEDLVELRVVANLLAVGIALPAVRKAARYGIRRTCLCMCCPCCVGHRRSSVGRAMHTTRKGQLATSGYGSGRAWLSGDVAASAVSSFSAAPLERGCGSLCCLRSSVRKLRQRMQTKSQSGPRSEQPRSSRESGTFVAPNQPGERRHLLAADALAHAH